MLKNNLKIDKNLQYQNYFFIIIKIDNKNDMRLLYRNGTEQREDTTIKKTEHNDAFE